MDEIINAVKKILSEYGENLYGKFSVVTKNKIRIRDIRLVAKLNVSSSVSRELQVL